MNDKTTTAFDITNPFADLQKQMKDTAYMFENKNAAIHAQAMENNPPPDFTPDLSGEFEPEQAHRTDFRDNTNEVSSKEPTQYRWGSQPDPVEEERPARNNPNQRISKLVHQLNQAHEKNKLYEQERESFLQNEKALAAELENKNELLITGYKTTLEEKKEEYERLLDISIQEGDITPRKQIRDEIKKLDEDLLRVKTYFTLKETGQAGNPAQFMNNNQNYTAPNPAPAPAQALTPAMQEFVYAHPEIMRDERFALRAHNLDNALAKQYAEKGYANWIGSEHYARHLDALYREGFEQKGRVNNNQSNSSASPALSAGQQVNAMAVFGKDPKTGKQRSQAEANQIYINEVLRKGAR